MACDWKLVEGTVTIGKTNLDSQLANANLSINDIKSVPVVNLFAGTRRACRRPRRHNAD